MSSQSNEKRIRELARKWLDQTISPDEEREFAVWYNAGQDEPVEVPSSFAESEEILKARILNKINNAIDDKKEHSKKMIPARWISIAASILLIVAAGTYFRQRNCKPHQAAIANQKKRLLNDVAPGGTKALLTLADGTKIVLNEAKNGVVANQGLTRLNKAKNDQLIYETDNKPQNNAPVVYNTISTPKGGQFTVVLSDGSKVWLNAASSITFPTTFSPSERKVTITGEVYFEVAKNKRLPFRVITSNQTVEVLGTHFNINAYADEGTIKTTLIEGSVKVSSGKLSAVLQPNQQADISANGADIFTIQTVDTEKVLAWKNGGFEFENEELSVIMNQVSRWYDVSVKYDGDVAKARFTGSISRNVNLSELLKMLKYTGIDFKIEGQTVIVKP
jgi:transmembrane sensor